MAVLTKDDVVQALSGLVEPAAIEGVQLQQQPEGVGVAVMVAIDPHKAVAMEPMRVQAENKLAAMAGVSRARVILTAHSGVKNETGAAPPRQTKKIPLPLIKRIIAVASGKGGVGKSTTAANLALAFARNGLKVGLLDADIYGPSMPRMFGVSGKPSVNEDKKLIPVERYGIKLMSMGFLVEEDAPMVWRGPMVHGAITQLFRDVAWGDVDVLVVDLPPGTGDAQLTLAQSVDLAGAVIVSTPQDIALIDARKGLNMFRRVDVPVLGIIENMSQFICPHCGGRSDIFGHGGAREEAAKLGVPFLGEVPLTLALRESGDAGAPIVEAEPDGEVAAIYCGMARRLV